MRPFGLRQDACYTGTIPPMFMDEDFFQAYEIECIRRASGMPTAEPRRLSRSSGLRSRSYYLDGPDGGSFVKCLDSGHRNPPELMLTLGHEAEGYAFFAGPHDGLIAVPALHFYQSFEGESGQELQVLGVTDLTACGASCTPADLLFDRSVSRECQDEAAALCGLTMARLVSSGFQNRLDRAKGVDVVRRQTEDILKHPDRARLLDLIANHPAIPWAYQNRVMGELNVLVPHWLDAARHTVASSSRAMVDRARRVLTHPDVVQAFSPGQSGDRIVFSPRDRHDGNTMLVTESGRVRRAYEIDLEFWGLETGGRLMGRYLAMMESSGRRRWSGEGRGFGQHLSHLMSVLLFHFVRGVGDDSAEVVLRALHLGTAGLYAAMLWLYMAAALPSEAAGSLEQALSCLGRPGRYLDRAAHHARSMKGVEAEQVESSIEQVQKAMQPSFEIVTGLL